MDLLDMVGMLYVVATPIGNLEDFSRRGADVLADVALIAAEDTRRTRVLLEAIGVAGVPIVALHSHNETAASHDVLARLRDGDAVALVSDAGTPLISDPGFELVRACWADRIPVIPIPGPSAAAAALSVCPLPGARYLFEGFLPARAGAREARLRELLDLGIATVFFEAPHRMSAMLEDLVRLAPGRRLLVGREMTKRHEQYLCDEPAGLLETLSAGDKFRGEFVCVLEGAEQQAVPSEVARIMEVLASELAPAQAARIGARLLGRKRRELYDLALSLGKGGADG